mmetsp:Transcript_38038/g.81237  ORF Transcript_38038/g.81237 Transcript_38038/m.81237 type:complete len:153 (+) Transcript_38038:119-577(+)
MPMWNGVTPQQEPHFLAGVTPAHSGDAPSWRVFSSFLPSRFNHREHRPPHDQKMIHMDGRRDESAIIRDWSDLGRLIPSIVHRPSDIQRNPTATTTGDVFGSIEEVRGGGVECRRGMVKSSWKQCNFPMDGECNELAVACTNDGPWAFVARQ